MNSDLFSILVSLNDMERTLVYIIKNSAYKQDAAQVAVDHIKDMRIAIGATRRVLDEVLVRQHEACNV